MKCIKYLAALLLTIMGSLQLMADDFNPTNPAEPYQNNKLTVTAKPAAAVSWLGGEGYYREGDPVILESYAIGPSYVFSHWEKDGEWYSNEWCAQYTMENKAITFTACYNYTPSSPDEPFNNDNRLYLVAEPLTACSFNIASGERYMQDQTIWLTATGKMGYIFLGWYNGGKLMSQNESFSFNMPEGDLTLTAKYEYNPMNPDEPQGDGPQDNVTTLTGDADGDGVVDVADAVRVINLCLTGEYDAKADVDDDGVVDVADAVAVINICLRN